jgi:predicted ATP-grasp superfamily ATP-dependent carboligase
MGAVKYNKHSLSGQLLDEKLTELGYNGETIAFGKYNNKRESLEILQDNELPIPDLMPRATPGYIGRPDLHSKGRWIYQYGDREKKKHPATHWLKWIDAKKEFRVHVIDGEVIKLQEKQPIGNYIEGESYFSYPHDFKYKKTLRDIAVRSVEALGLDFGAVDILWDDSFYILEINTAPCLTRSEDTLNRYVKAFMRRTPASISLLYPIADTLQYNNF